MIQKYLETKRPMIEEMLSQKPNRFLSDQYHHAIHFTILCYADDSPLHDIYQDVDQKRAYAEKMLNCSDVVTEEGSMYLYVLEEFLIKFQNSYRYEFLVTCHILLSENNKELRQPITGIVDADKRAKTAEVRARLLQNNRDTIEMIDTLNKVIFGQNEDLKKIYDKKRPSVEERVKNASL
jgi:hypothetical protein